MESSLKEDSGGLNVSDKGCLAGAVHENFLHLLELLVLSLTRTGIRPTCEYLICSLAQGGMAPLWMMIE